MLYLKQSTASQAVLLGPFIDDTDGATAETGLTIANTDIRLSANGGNMFAKTSGGGTHDENGWYTITLDATDTATVGRLQISCKVSGALAAWMECEVLEEAVYDALFAASAPGYLQPTTAGRTLDVTATGAAGIDWGNVENQNSTVDLSATDIQLCDTVTTNTDMLTAAAVNAEVDTALTDIKLDHLVAVADADDVVDNSIIAKLANSGATADWSAYVNTTDSLMAIRDRGDSAWTTGAGGSDRLLMVDTTIATLSTQTSFTLTAGSTDDDAYNGCTIVIEDVSTSTQKAIGIIDDYTGSTKTVTLLEDPAVFTMAATDKVYVLAEKGLKPTTAADYHVDVTSGGAVGIDWGNVENQGTTVDLSATDIQLVDTVTTYTGNTVQTGDAFARLGAPTGALVSADIATVDGNVDTLITNVPDVISQANINAEVDTAIETYGLDHLVSASVTGTDITDNSIIAKLVSKEATADWDDFVNTTESLQALRDHIADGTNLTEAGGTGDHLTALATASALSTAQADLDTITDTGVTAVALTSAAITDVWSTDALTEAYAADGAEGTAAQLLYLILSACSEFAVSGTTLTCKKLDGSTAAATYTLDDASSPTSRTRAT